MAIGKEGLQVEFPVEVSIADNCFCNACHGVGRATKIKLPDTRYRGLGMTVLATAYDDYWLCDSCKGKLVEALGAVEVVRCKDCKLWRRNVGFTDSPNGHCFCIDMDTNQYDFCSFGERRDSDV